MTDCKRKTANLLDFDALKNAQSGTIYTIGGTGYSVPHLLTLDLKPNTTYTLSSNYVRTSSNLNVIYLQYADIEYAVSSNNSPSFTTTTGIVKIGFFDTRTGADEFLSGTAVLMLSEGSTALPYEPYGWQHSLRKLTTATDTLTTLPADIYADGNNATVGISGNTVQSGTPTPDSPIMPQGTGERTAQLYFKKIVGGSIGADGGIIGNASFDCYVAKVEANQQYIGTGYVYAFYTSEPALGSVSYNGQRTVSPVANGFTSPIDGYVAVRHNADVTDAMLNSGSTALPYEPYGYKIPISSASTTTPVYLGEVETTRKIKKLVLTGEEGITSTHTDVGLFNIPVTDYLKIANVATNICSHYLAGTNVGGWADVTDRTSRFYANPASAAKLLYIRDSSYTTVADFKSYLAAQYAAGTPVTVWYVLATETTGIVNEPLMKIGDYADTVSGITIPTITSKDTFDVDTTLKPSEVSLSYTGWHDSTVKEWDGSEWS